MFVELKQKFLALQKYVAMPKQNLTRNQSRPIHKPTQLKLEAPDHHQLSSALRGSKVARKHPRRGVGRPRKKKNPTNSGTPGQITAQQDPSTFEDEGQMDEHRTMENIEKFEPLRKNFGLIAYLITQCDQMKMENQRLRERLDARKHYEHFVQHQHDPPSAILAQHPIVYVPPPSTPPDVQREFISPHAINVGNELKPVITDLPTKPKPPLRPKRPDTAPSTRSAKCWQNSPPIFEEFHFS